MTADDQKALGFEHAIWDTRKPIRAGDLVTVVTSFESQYRLARVLRAERHDIPLVVGLDGAPLTTSGMARVVKLMRSV